MMDIALVLVLRDCGLQRAEVNLIQVGEVAQLRRSLPIQPVAAEAHLCDTASGFDFDAVPIIFEGGVSYLSFIAQFCPSLAW